MEELLELIKPLQDVVLNPDFNGAVGVFFVSVINEITGIFPLAIVLSGQMAFLDGTINFEYLIKLYVFVVLPVALGSTLGTLPIYSISYFSGYKALDHFGKYLNIEWSDVSKFSSKFKNNWHDEIIFLIFRSIPFFPALPVNIVAGIIQYNLYTYLLLTLIGFSIRMSLSFLMVGIGIISLSKVLIFLYNI